MTTVTFKTYEHEETGETLWTVELEDESGTSSSGPYPDYDTAFLAVRSLHEPELPAFHRLQDEDQLRIVDIYTTYLKLIDNLTTFLLETFYDTE